MPLTQTTAYALEKFYLRLFLPFQFLVLEFNFTLILNHGNYMGRADKRAFGAPNTPIVVNCNLSPKCRGDRDFFFRVEDGELVLTAGYGTSRISDP